jgi:hypothetical protein
MVILGALIAKSFNYLNEREHKRTSFTLKQPFIGSLIANVSFRASRFLGFTKSRVTRDRDFSGAGTSTNPFKKFVSDTKTFTTKALTSFTTKFI